MRQSLAKTAADLLGDLCWWIVRRASAFATRNMNRHEVGGVTLMSLVTRRLRIVPPFAMPDQYSELRGGNSGRWRFVTNRNVSINLEDFIGIPEPLSAFCDPCERLVFMDYDDRTWAWIDHKWNLTISAGYAWNGCSPKWWAFNRWWGTPDPVWSRISSLFHDIGYQFLHTDHFPLNREAVDMMFYNLMVGSGATPEQAGAYYGAVKHFGCKFIQENDCYSQIERLDEFDDEPESERIRKMYDRIHGVLRQAKDDIRNATKPE